MRIYGFNESGFSYVISRDGQELERSVSFTATGMEAIETFPFMRMKTIAGAVGRNGQIISGTGFTISHSPGSGSYRVTFTTPLSMIKSDQPPKVEIIPDTNGFLALGTGDDVTFTDTVSGTVMADGCILEGTTLPNAGYAFTVSKNTSFPGYYTVKFRPELNVKLLLPIALKVDVIDLERSFHCCTMCDPCINEDIIAQGVQTMNVDRNGFTYRTYVETLTRRIYTDLPVTFTAIVTREVC